MRKGTRLFAAVLCLLLAGCGARPAEEVRQPAAQSEGPAEPAAAMEEAEPEETADSYTGRWRDGTYDEAWEGIDYIGTHYREDTADGERRTSTVLEEETGLLYLDGDGALLWEDTFEHMGDGLRFTRET